MCNSIKTYLKSDTKGTIAIEFAVLLPLVLLTFIGLFEISNYIYCNNKMNRTAQNMSNIVARGPTTQSQLDQELTAVDYLALPFNFQQNGNIVVTSISRPPENNQNNPPQVISWRRSYPGGTGDSRISAGSLPGGYALEIGENVIATEVLYTYVPILGSSVLPTTIIYASALATPRIGDMSTLPPN